MEDRSQGSGSISENRNRIESSDKLWSLASGGFKICAREELIIVKQKANFWVQIVKYTDLSLWWKKTTASAISWQLSNHQIQFYLYCRGSGVVGWLIHLEKGLVLLLGWSFRRGEWGYCLMEPASTTSTDSYGELYSELHLLCQRWDHSRIGLESNKETVAS